MPSATPPRRARSTPRSRRCARARTKPATERTKKGGGWPAALLPRSESLFAVAFAVGVRLDVGIRAHAGLRGRGLRADVRAGIGPGFGVGRVVGGVVSVMDALLRLFGHCSDGASCRIRRLICNSADAIDRGIDGGADAV